MKKILFESSNKLTKIHAYVWEPEGEPVGIIQLIHGMQEHMGRYTDFAQYLAGKGFVVVGHDQLGHGKTAVTEDQLGFISKEHPSDTLIMDIHRLRKGTMKKYPMLPYFIFGHSMGSYLLRKYISKFGYGLAGVIICGTGNENPAKAKAGLALIGALTKKYGQYHRSKFITETLFSGPYSEFDMTGNDPENSWLTKDTEIVAKYYNDPMCKTIFTLNGYNALISTVIYDCSPAAYKKVPKDLPILIVSGDRDPVGNFGKGPTKVYENYLKADISDVTLRLFNDDRHEILNELDRADIYSYIHEWIEDRLISDK
ncbi:MAG: alpha/beta hydrolase [Eubacterium sp.]|nr:alpha/beta hydrolase [Eubacterium sp.]